MSLAVFTIVYAVFIIFELIPLYKSKKYKEGILYTLLLIFAYYVQNFYAYDMGFLNPNVFIIKAVEYFIK